LAEGFFQQALSINRCQLGENHIRVAILLSKIAMIYRSERRFQEAKLLLERALDIKVKSLGPDDLEAAHTLQELGVVLMGMEQFPEADEKLKRALAIRLNAAGTVESEMVAEVMCNLARNYAQWGKLQEAYDYFTQVSIINHTVGSRRIAKLIDDLRWLETSATSSWCGLVTKIPSFLCLCLFSSFSLLLILGQMRNSAGSLGDAATPSTETAISQAVFGYYYFIFFHQQPFSQLLIGFYFSCQLSEAVFPGLFL